MIAQRFRPLGWVAGVAAAACALYLISLQVASERGRLEAIDRKIAMTKRDIRQLQTELNTRANLRQLERWNGEVLALSAPAAGQYLANEAALANFDASGLSDKPAAPTPVMMAVLKADPEPAPQPGLIERLVNPAPARPVTPTGEQARAAPGGKPALDKKPQRVALLDRSALSDLSRVAAAEKQSRKPGRP